MPPDYPALHSRIPYEIVWNIFPAWRMIDAMADHPTSYREYDLSARLYDHVIPYRDRQEDVRFYLEHARTAGPRVLELGCGTGRVLLPVARAGVAITGVELSGSMLAICRDKLAAEPAEVQSRVRLVEADMRRVDLGETYSLAMIPFRPFQHLLTVDDQLACLRSIHRHLRPGGALVFDLFNPSLQMLVDETHTSEWGDEPEFTTPAGERVLRRARVARRDWLHQIQDLEMIYYVTSPDGSTRRDVESFRLRHLFRYEVEHLLVRAGFENVRVYSDFGGTPFGTKYPGELVIVASRPTT
jgi:SAM-dependent methyltransferase